MSGAGGRADWSGGVLAFGAAGSQDSATAGVTAAPTRTALKPTASSVRFRNFECIGSGSSKRQHVVTAWAVSKLRHVPSSSPRTFRQPGNQHRKQSRRLGVCSSGPVRRHAGVPLPFGAGIRLVRRRCASSTGNVLTESTYSLGAVSRAVAPGNAPSKRRRVDWCRSHAWAIWVNDADTDVPSCVGVTHWPS